jgi:nitrile hydratase subunit beta
MNGVHDLGGMHGFGPIVRDPNEPLFRTDWEEHVHTIGELLLEHRYFTVDAFRYGIERMEPAHYLRAPYFERWLATIELNLVENGFLSGDELDARTEYFRQYPEATPPRGDDISPVREAQQQSNAPAPAASRFAVGDMVVARNAHPRGHTRLPRYARGKRGTIQRLHGPQIFPDTNALGLGEHPQPLYNVRFEARELWGESAEPDQVLTLDLWESYLESLPR